MDAAGSSATRSLYHFNPIGRYTTAASEESAVHSSASEESKTLSKHRRLGQNKYCNERWFAIPPIRYTNELDRTGSRSHRSNSTRPKPFIPKPTGHTVSFQATKPGEPTSLIAPSSPSSVRNPRSPVRGRGQYARQLTVDGRQVEGRRRGDQPSQQVESCDRAQEASSLDTHPTAFFCTVSRSRNAASCPWPG